MHCENEPLLEYLWNYNAQSLLINVMYYGCITMVYVTLQFIVKLNKNKE